MVGPGIGSGIGSALQRRQLESMGSIGCCRDAIGKISELHRWLVPPVILYLIENYFKDI